VHNYRWPLGPAEGEAEYGQFERRLAEGSALTVRTITLEGDASGPSQPDPSAYEARFSGTYSQRTIEGGIGHNLPHEAPKALARLLVDVDGAT
jgi:pimeloyl-ACP methyl ester carboxylesterase